MKVKNKRGKKSTPNSKPDLKASKEEIFKQYNNQSPKP